jgi:hypothetical protein
LRPSKPKPGFFPNTRKPRVSGAQACREQLRAGLRRKEGFIFLGPPLKMAGYYQAARVLD